MNAIARASQDVAGFLRQKRALLLVPISIAVGALLVMPASQVVVLATLVAAPLLMAQFAIIRNLFIGVVIYLIFEYLQPGFRIHALRVIRPTALVAAALVLAWILNVIRHRVPLVINWQVKSYLILLFLGLLSALQAISAGMVAVNLFALAKTFVVFWVIFSAVRKYQQLWRLTWVYVILHVILAVGGFALFVTAGQRRFGDVGGSFLGDENDSAMALLIMIPYMYFLLPLTNRFRSRAFLGAGMLLGSLTVLFSFSRGAFVGFMTMVLYIWWKGGKRFKTGIILALLVLAIFAAMPAEYWDRIESTKNYTTEGSAQGRLDAWKGGIRMMIDSPLLGCGLGNFSRAYGTMYNTISTRWTAPHSLYIEFIGQLGVPGLIFIISVIYLTLSTIGRARRMVRGLDGEEPRSLERIMLGAECGFVTYLVSTFFLGSLQYPHLWHFGMMAGVGLTVARDLRAKAAPALGEVPGSPGLT
jgi:probable O-glycosylation ligase (exosortase A-associated)